MELITIEATKVVHLIQLYRPAGQLFLPAAAAKLIQRYSFSKPPSSIDDLTKEAAVFGIGLFNDIGINELAIYPDGLIVSSRADADKLVLFVEDLVNWSKAEFGFVELDIKSSKTLFESQIVVRAGFDLISALAPITTAGQMMNKRLSAYPYMGEISPAAFVLDSDSTFSPTLRPSKFTLERRIGLPYGDNIYYSTAPFRTKDHLAYLEDLETLFRQNKKR
ncbi:hypothetical protein [Rhodoplanes sp. SY1]|uniref:hypothetical protein n=1 Tax=Rhodoplanes sp. SY1 TaxID=3166646 RepID=UPI0038B69FA7